MIFDDDINLWALFFSTLLQVTESFVVLMLSDDSLVLTCKLCGSACVQFLFLSGNRSKTKKARLENEEFLRGWLVISTFLWVDRESEREQAKKIPKSHCGRYRLAPSGPDKEKQRNNIIARWWGEREIEKKVGIKERLRKIQLSWEAFEVCELVVVLFEWSFVYAMRTTFSSFHNEIICSSLHSTSFWLFLSLSLFYPLTHASTTRQKLH